MKKSGMLFALLAVMLLMFAFVPLTARAFTADELAAQINGFDHGGTGTLKAIVTGGNIVNVTSSAPITGVAKELTLNIDPGVTVIWNADYTSSESSYNNLIKLTGNGIFEITASGSIRSINMSDYSHAIIEDYGCRTAIISSGTVHAEKGYAISSYGPVTVNGGTISSDDFFACIYAVSTNVTVNNGTVRSPSYGTPIDTSSCIVNINGGAVYTVYGKIAILTTNNNSKAIINGGFVFSNTQAIMGTGYPAEYTISYHSSASEPTISGNAVVCAWKKPAAPRDYTENTRDKLFTNAGAAVKWAIKGDKQGIYYAKGANIGFYEMGTDIVSVKPAAPTNFTAATGAGGVTLNWTNNSGSVSYNRVNRKESGEWSAIATIPASATAYIDDTAEAGNTYIYNVAAYAATGIAGVSSEALVTIPGTAYKVTVKNGEGSGKYEPGATVNIKANAAPAGMVFDRWTTADGITFASEMSASTTFIMPSRAVTVTPTYKVKLTCVKTLPALYIRKGKYITLPAVAYPYNATYKTLTWISEEPNIAKVVNPMTGRIKAMKVGKTNIIVTNDEKKTAKCAVYVVSTSTALTALKITPDAATTLAAGDVLQVKVTLTPANATGIVPRFLSIKPAVASIDTLGMITALSPGKTTITVMAGVLGKTFVLTVK